MVLLAFLAVLAVILLFLFAPELLIGALGLVSLACMGVGTGLLLAHFFRKKGVSTPRSFDLLGAFLVVYGLTFLLSYVVIRLCAGEEVDLLRFFFLKGLWN